MRNYGRCPGAQFDVILPRDSPPSRGERVSDCVVYKGTRMLNHHMNALRQIQTDTRTCVEYTFCLYFAVYRILRRLKAKDTHAQKNCLYWRAYARANSFLGTGLPDGLKKQKLNY